MKLVIRSAVALACALCLFDTAAAQANAGTEEFGMSPKQLVEAVEKVEALISKCMREQGFDYIAADYNTVRRGMNADKSLPGVSEKQFIAKHGFGLSTMYTGEPPQLASGYSPAKIALGDRNVQVYKALSSADQVAYNRALFGQNTGASFAVSLEMENFSFIGGCTRKGVEQVFKPDELKASYYNPKDAAINKDARMKAALRTYAAEMRKAGFDYAHPDDVEHDVRRRLAALTGGGTIAVDKMTAAQKAGLKELQDYERRVAVKNFQLTEEVVDPVKEKIEKELFARKSQ